MKPTEKPFDLAEWIGRKPALSPASVPGTETIREIIECALRWMGDDAGNICNPPPPTWQPVIPVMLASLELREALDKLILCTGAYKSMPCQRARMEARAVIAKAGSKSV